MNNVKQMIINKISELSESDFTDDPSQFRLCDNVYIFWSSIPKISSNIPANVSHDVMLGRDGNKFILKIKAAPNFNQPKYHVSWNNVR